MLLFQAWFGPEKRTFFSNKEHFWFKKKNIFSAITLLDLNLFFFRVFVLRVTFKLPQIRQSKIYKNCWRLTIRVPNLSSSYSNNQEKICSSSWRAVLYKNQNDHDQFDFPKFLLFMHKMFVLYSAPLHEEQNIYYIFAPLHEQNVYFIFCSSSKWKRNNKKYVERRKFTETTFKCASYTYTVRMPMHLHLQQQKIEESFW
jgi:hypothetical protein